MLGDPRSRLRSAAEALQDQQDGLEQAKVKRLSSIAARPSRPREATCDVQGPICNNHMGFQPNQTSDLLSSRAPAASSAPTPSAHATAAAVRSLAAHTDYAKMEGRFGGTVDKKMRSDAKMVGLTVDPRWPRYVGADSHSPSLEAIIIAGQDRDLSL